MEGECTCTPNQKHSINFNVEFVKQSPYITKLVCTKCKGVVAWIEDERIESFKNQYDPQMLKKWT